MSSCYLGNVNSTVTCNEKEASLCVLQRADSCSDVHLNDFTETNLALRSKLNQLVITTELSCQTLGKHCIQLESRVYVLIHNEEHNRSLDEHEKID